MLFERTSRRVFLSDTGARLLPRARGVVGGMAGLRSAAVARPRETAGVLRIGLEANGFAELTRPILATFRARHPDIVPVLREFGGVAQAFFDGHLDVALTRSPLLDPRLDVNEMAIEPRGLLVGADHPRAGMEGGSIADFLDDPFVALCRPAAPTGSPRSTAEVSGRASAARRSPCRRCCTRSPTSAW